jgi:hypothetical protein
MLKIIFGLGIFFLVVAMLGFFFGLAREMFFNSSTANRKQHRKQARAAAYFGSGNVHGLEANSKHDESSNYNNDSGVDNSFSNNDYGSCAGDYSSSSSTDCSSSSSSN